MSQNQMFLFMDCQTIWIGVLTMMLGSSRKSQICSFVGGACVGAGIVSVVILLAKVLQ